MKKWWKCFVRLIVIFHVYPAMAEVQGAETRPRVFQNQLISLGANDDSVIQHAKQMGYDYVNGQPWSAKRARRASDAGLGVLFNTSADIAKWLRFNPQLTTVNSRPITAHDLANFDIALCMQNPQATTLGERFHIDRQFSNEKAIIFHPNYFSGQAIDINIAYNIELFESHGGTAIHAGVYVDQINTGGYNPFPGPCLNPVAKDFATSIDGQLEYIKRLQHYFRDQLGLPMSGNPYRMTQYQSRHLVAPFDLYYNEKGTLDTNHVSDFGAIPPDRVAVTVSRQFNNDYLQALRTAGIAMQQRSWFGWFNSAHPSRTNNGVQLLRALPNWDNLVKASERSWNPDTLVYQTSNSYADPNVVYGRHPKTSKLFVVFQSLQGVLHLRPREEVTDVKRVDNLFIETTNGRDDLAISGSRVTLENASNLGKGYVVTVD